MELEDILSRVWQNGYLVERVQWQELKAELRAYFGEQIAGEIEALEGYDFMNLRKTLIDRDAVLNLVRGKKLR